MDSYVLLSSIMILSFARGVCDWVPGVNIWLHNLLQEVFS